MSGGKFIVPKPPTGNWTDESGSIAIFIPNGGMFEGWYQPAAIPGSSVEKTSIFGGYKKVDDGYLITFYTRCTIKNNDETIKHGITTWCGKYFNENPDKLSLDWMSVSDTSSTNSQTRIGRDIFRKT